MGSRGFTLLEALISLSIMAVVALTALAALRFGIGVMERGEMAADEAFIMRYFSGHFQSVCASAYPYATDDGALVFEGRADRLALVSAALPPHPGVPWGGARLVEYSSGERGLAVREATVPSAGEPAIEGIPLSISVERASFAYLGESGWEQGWDAGARQRLPDAVKATIYIRGRQEPMTFVARLGRAAVEAKR